MSKEDMDTSGKKQYEKECGVTSDVEQDTKEWQKRTQTVDTKEME